MTTTEPTRRAQLDVQLVGHTVFTPPTKELDDGNTDLVFWPDEGNELPVPLGSLRQFDGQSLAEFAGRACYLSFDRPNPGTATNAKYLLNTVGKQKHWSIAEHGSVSFWITGISRSCSHELVRHRHFSYSQLSQRYVDSEGTAIVLPPDLHNFKGEGDWFIEDSIEKAEKAVRDAYCAIKDTLFLAGLSKKQVNQAARAVLMGSTETRMVMTGNYRAWANFLVQRDSPAADAEIRAVAQKIGRKLADHAPNIFGPEARALWDDSAEHGVAGH